MTEFYYPEDLPVVSRRTEIVACLREHPVVIIAGETGSGKTTQLPKMCLEAGWGRTGLLGCTQPRRVAASSISRRVAEEMKVAWGQEVGCKVRFEDRTSPRTQVKFMTDGILLAEIQSDPLLRRYSALILDEAHERSLNVDFLLGYLRHLRPRRPDLRLVVTSATLDTEAFSQAFGNAPVLQVSGRLWPVEIRYLPLETGCEDGDLTGETTLSEACIRTTENCLLESADGDVLVFLPTENDIREVFEGMQSALGRGTEVLSLFGRMASADQQRVFQPGPQRRVILATNIAETSLTIPRVRYVIDSGLARMSRYNPRTRTKRLPVEEISQSSANQRAGRAGRVREGVAIRLYSEENFAKRPPHTQPEIQRANLAEVILRMQASGLGDIESFPFLCAPSPASIRAGYKQLHELGALSETFELTALGREMARIPVDPTLARMLLQARKERVLDAILPIAAALSIPDPRERPEAHREAANEAHRRFAHPDSDFLTLLRIWNDSPLPQTSAGNNALRRFCKAHFLSFPRMREWRDVAQQLRQAAEALPHPDSESGRRQASRPSAKHSSPGGRSRETAAPPAPDSNAAPSSPGVSSGGGFHTQTSSSQPASSRPPTLPPSSPPPNLPASALPPISGSPFSPSPTQPVARPLNRPSKFPPATPRSGTNLNPPRSPDSSRYAPAAPPGSALPTGASSPGGHPSVFDDPARIQAVHRSILSGLLTHVALRQGPNQYQAAGNRSLLLFPGSSLHRKGPGKKQSRWIMAAELVETSQLFARNAAAIDPHWILHLGPHLLRSSYSEPAWNAAAGRVLVLEKFLLQGLEIARKHTDYGKINPEHATELFIRGALLDPETPIPLRFFQLNRQTRQRVEESLTRIRHSHAHSLDECLYLFYAARIQKVSSLPDLFSYIEKKTASEPDFCVLQESDLTGDLSISHDRTLFPEKVTLQNTVLPVSYAYTPGEETDGATLQIPLPALSTLSPAQIQWAVPGLRAQQVQSLLQALPRSLRRQLAPLEPKITEILEAFRPGEAAFLESFAHFLSNRYRVPISASDWPPEPLPAHLLPRVEIIDSSRRTVSSGRNWETLTLSASRHDHRSPAWRAAENRWHREPSSSWSFGDLPDSIFIEEIAGAPFHAHPGLEPHASAAQPRLYRDPAEAAIQTRKAIRILAKNLLSTPIASAERALLQCRTSASSQKASALSANKSFGSLSLTPTPDARRQIHSEHFGTRAAEMILESLCVWEPLLPLSQSRFLAFTDSAKRSFPALLERTLESTRQIVNLEKTLRGALKKYPGMDADLNRLLPEDFPRQVPLEQFERIPRFLKAIQVRAERAHLRPAQDAQKAEQLRPFADWERKVPEAKRSSFRWLLEELRVSLFAQELGTAETVSVARLQRFGEF